VPLPLLGLLHQSVAPVGVSCRVLHHCVTSYQLPPPPPARCHRPGFGSPTSFLHLARLPLMPPVHHHHSSLGHEVPVIIGAPHRHPFAILGHLTGIALRHSPQ
jgi:hypothetical protein